MSDISVDFEHTTLPVLHRCDAVVIGGSFGGIAAALRLAQAGKRVTLVESRTYLGREITATLRPWLGVPDDTPALIMSVLRAAGSGHALNLDTLKIHLEDVLLQAGVKLLYASLVVGLQQDTNGLHGVVIGNKSGRQVIECDLLLDTSDTALVARLLGEAFESAPSGLVPYCRTLEFDNVSADLPLNQPLVLDGVKFRLFQGYRGAGHVLVECPLALPFANDTAFDLTERETQARHQTMAVAAALMQNIPAFESAYLSGASYELYGMTTPRLRPVERQWTQGLHGIDLTLEPDSSFSLVDFAGSVAGIWYLNEAVPLAHVPPQEFYNPVFTCRIGAALAQTLCDHWERTAATNTAPVKVSAPVAVTSSPVRVREPSSSQRGRLYPRVPVQSVPLPILREADVLVVGGGSSGATAVITAASAGMQTVLVEMNPGLGGTGTFGGVQSYWFGRRTGFSQNVLKLVVQMHDYLHQPPPKGIIPKWNIEAKAYALLQEADAQGIDLLTNTFVIGTIVEGNRVCGVAVATPAGVGLIRARVVIDATGDGDVAAFAGADFVYGSERDHITMWYALAQFPRPGLTRNHFTSMVDVSNIEDYTRAILAGRRRGSQETMHDHGIYVAPRESRHIQADVVLTLTDQLRGRRWPDVVNIAFSNHDVKGHSGSDWLRIGLIPPNLEIEIPYRALLPRGLDGILVVGKAISATHDALPAIRMQADLENLGGVAALAAEQSIQEGVGLRDISIKNLQSRLVSELVLPPEMLTRTLHEVTYSDDDLRQMIAALPVLPLYQYSDMELTDLYTGTIPLVEICCAGPLVIPLLEAAHVEAEGERKLLLAQMLALVGSSAGVTTLISAIMPQLQGERLPARTTHIRYTQLPPDHGAMPDVVYLLYSLGMTPDSRALPVWRRVVDLLAAASEAGFYEEMPGLFYYVDAVCYGAERSGLPDCISLLRQLHTYAPFHNRAAYGGFQPDNMLERLAYLELIIGRALARCGSVDGFIILVSYLSDNRALLAEHAHSELVAITGEDYGKDGQVWSNWIELNADRNTVVPWRPPTEAMQAWAAPENHLR